ncbi:hypothetical protein H0H93_013690 [Arthromyces matolae]|nr:hypothetical protein H0H93_013690 [Arthromyces matolae]
MGRPKLYHTAEERRVANAAKSKRSYHRNKSTISDRRKVLYRERTGQSDKTEGPSKRTQDPVETCKIPVRGLGYWSSRVDFLAKKHRILIGHSPYTYVDNIYHNFSISHRKLGIREALDEHNNLQTKIQQCQNEILQIDGMSDEWKRSDKVLKGVESVLFALQDLLCAAMTDESELMHQNKELKYQTDL